MDDKERTVCWCCHKEECDGGPTCAPAQALREEARAEDTVRNVVLGIVAVLIVTMFLVMLSLGGCTPSQTSALSSGTRAAITATKIAACVQGAMAEEQLEALRERREAEAAAEIEADRLRSTIGVPSSISQEVDKVMRGDGGVQ